MNFLLFAPDYWHASAGIRALYLLRDYLTKLGNTVYHLNYSRHAETKVYPEDTVVIMPETCPIITPGVPVIRWALNHPGKLGGPTKYGPNEFVIHWDGMEETASLAAHNGTSHELTLGLMQRPKIENKRHLFCLWYEGKGQSDGTHHPEAIRVTRHWPPSQDELFSLFERCTCLYSYDDFSGINLEAHMYGVEVLIRTQGKWKAYQPPENIEKFLVNPARDMVNIAAMLDLFNQSK